MWFSLVCESGGWQENRQSECHNFVEQWRLFKRSREGWNESESVSVGVCSRATKKRTHKKSSLVLITCSKKEQRTKKSRCLRHGQTQLFSLFPLFINTLTSPFPFQAAMSEFMRGLQAFERLVKSDEGVRTGSCGKCGGSKYNKQYLE